MRNSRLAYLFNPALIACVLMIGALMSAASAKAQSASPIGTVNIPFTFHIGSQEMPAGMYRITSESVHSLLLRGPNKAFVLVHAKIARKAPSQAVVVFHRYGETYFLAEVWLAGASDGLECTTTRTEKQMIHASNTQAPSLTTLALNSAPRP